MSEPKSNANESQSEEKKAIALDVHQNIARKFLQGTAQTLIRWMPMGGSGWVLLSFAKEQEWLMALLMFPVMITSVVWAAYTKSVLERLAEIYQERGRRDVDALMTLQERLDRAIKWQFAGTEDKYLRCQGNECRNYRTEGYNPESFIPQLRDVFVPLELSDGFIRSEKGRRLPLHPGFQGEKMGEKELKRLEKMQEEGVSIWYLLANAKKIPAYCRLAVLAWGGYGKTTLLRNITYTYSCHKHRAYNAPKLLPVLIYLRKWQKAIARDKPNLSSLVEAYHIPNLPQGKDLKLPPNWAKNLLKRGKMLVMIDGFDEVRSEWRKAISEWIEEQLREYPQMFFILTSRPTAYDESCAVKGQLSSLFVKPFSEEQRARFVEKWYLYQERCRRGDRNTPDVQHIARENAADLLAQIDKRQQVADLTKNPLLLTMIANLHRSYPNKELPKYRTELYYDICKLQLRDRPRSKRIEILLPFEQFRRVLQGIALGMRKQNQTRISLADLEGRLQDRLSFLDLENPVTVKDLLVQIEQVSELMVWRDEDYEFAHLSFQNYFAAMEVKDTDNEALLLHHLAESGWRETIQLYTSLVKPSPMIRALCDLNTPEAIDLAYVCWQESSRKIESELKEEIQRLRYQWLEEYLQNGEWKKADEETYRVMLQTVGKKMGKQYLSVSDIHNFPCEDLRIINQLWLDYSNNRFGFSVQKNIWLSVGGRPGEEYNYELYEKYAQKVKWYDEKGDYVGSEKIIFRGDAPEGHLPFDAVCMRWSLGLSMGEYKVLFSRAETCNL
ncbi:MAG: GUN4 domain-containing protein [Cyanobacteria bacterium SBLK]|nr:GUN4 domain-containing protein [Cyanobacteria bacterium SBLK]